MTAAGVEQVELRISIFRFFCSRFVHLLDDRVTIKTANDTRLEVERSKIARRLESPAQS